MPEPNIGSTPDDLTHYMEATSHLKSENVRFRAALTRIAAATTDHALTRAELRDFMEFAGNEARKALNGVPYA